MIFYFYFTNYSKSSVYFAPTAHLNWDSPHFKQWRETSIFPKLLTTLPVHGPEVPKPCPLTV